MKEQHKEGVAAWNAWRADLSGADLTDADLPDGLCDEDKAVAPPLQR